MELLLQRLPGPSKSFSLSWWRCKQSRKNNECKNKILQPYLICWTLGLIKLLLLPQVFFVTVKARRNTFSNDHTHRCMLSWKIQFTLPEDAHKKPVRRSSRCAVEVWSSFQPIPYSFYFCPEQYVCCQTIKTRLERAQIEHEDGGAGGKIQGFPWTYSGQACI